MKQRTTMLVILMLLLALPALGARDIRIDPDYDPRIEMRVVVLPAQLNRELKGVDRRTVSSLFATELLRIYEVLDLLRFEEALAGRKFTLDDAFSDAAKTTVKEHAGVDAIASLEIYRWEEGTSGIPFISRKSGRVGARVRVMDPYSGRVYWSINRLDKVKPGMDFLDRATYLFRDVVEDLEDELADIAEELNDREEYADEIASASWPSVGGYRPRKHVGLLQRERDLAQVRTPQPEFEPERDPAAAQVDSTLDVLPPIDLEQESGPVGRFPSELDTLSSGAAGANGEQPVIVPSQGAQ